MKKCQFCAEDIQDAATVCKHCGRDLLSVQAAPPKRKSNLGRNILIGVGILIALSAIGRLADTDPSAPAATRGDVPTTGNRAHDQLAAMAEPTRTAFFTKMFDGGDDPCGTVVRTFYQGSVKSSNAAMWNVGCSNGRSYSITVNNDALGSTRLLDCNVLKAVAKVDCFTKY